MRSTLNSTLHAMFPTVQVNGVAVAKKPNSNAMYLMTALLTANESSVGELTDAALKGIPTALQQASQLATADYSYQKATADESSWGGEPVD